MADIYDGTEGDDALAAGYSVMDGTEDWTEGWKSVNRSRDYVARLRTWVTTTIAALWPLPMDKGGTGQTTPEGARAALGAVTDGIGTGLEFYSPGFNRLAFKAPGVTNGTELQNAGGGGYLPLTGGTVTGDVLLPNATPATSGYTVAYLNADGRISKGASSERYKEDVHQIDPAALGDIFPDLYTFRMIGSDTTRVGWIAERLAEHPDLLPFVVYARYVTIEDGTATDPTIVTDEHGDPVPDSIDFIALLIAQNAQLHQAVDLLAQRITALEVPA